MVARTGRVAGTDRQMHGHTYWQEGLAEFGLADQAGAAALLVTVSCSLSGQAGEASHLRGGGSGARRTSAISTSGSQAAREGWKGTPCKLS